MATTHGLNRQLLRGFSLLINDDVYAFGGTINILGTVSGSVITFGGTTTISGA